MRSKQARAVVDHRAPSGTDSPASRFSSVRSTTERLCAGLEPEDFVLQSMPDASPVKWHLAHTTWFFETFVLRPFCGGYDEFDPAFAFLFNSYYNAVGPRWPRPQRGLLSRPTVGEVFRYRAYVDARMNDWLRTITPNDPVRRVIETGLNHEQQHQELILTDIKHAFSLNPLRPVFHDRPPAQARESQSQWCTFYEGIREIGHDGIEFAFDNETPRHRVFLNSFRLANRLVTNREYRGFIDDGGYDRPEFWLSDGWATRQSQQWTAPLYWTIEDGTWSNFTLNGQRPIDWEEPVCHVSYYEADAFARWAGARLPTEAEWETAAAGVPISGPFLESENFHPAAGATKTDEVTLAQLYGDVWQWTASPYSAYPGYTVPTGAIGEYNAKFMCNQFVLRGASCATPRSHARSTYRNFFPPDARWQFTGIRLAKDLAS
jgi:ergothioneine biosynthesis protein EgtB